MKRFDSEKAHILIKKMKCINKMHHTLIDKEVSELGLHRSQHMLLMYLVRNGESVSQKEIADHFEISPAAVAVTLKKLEVGGYILRSTVDDDNRKNSVIFTKKGKDIVEKSRVIFENVDSKMLELITDDEYDILTRCFEKMQQGLKDFDK